MAESVTLSRAALFVQMQVCAYHKGNTCISHTAFCIVLKCPVRFVGVLACAALVRHWCARHWWGATLVCTRLGFPGRGRLGNHRVDGHMEHLHLVPLAKIRPAEIGRPLSGARHARGSRRPKGRAFQQCLFWAAKGARRARVGSGLPSEWRKGLRKMPFEFRRVWGARWMALVAALRRTG